ncbi:hypothetical protein SAMN04487888_101371 [Eubacterium callanderi]|uniref:hypothetical protein n=1 Tax=Eubacterium callanderi TaxID=53442 RepID=UPI0008ECEB8B|nr:hypothetical protein [Eubacterium callanderi]SFO30367.1 hypothetical protein SAMN04487888_101371 [Eubacterium callanderi]
MKKLIFKNPLLLVLSLIFAVLLALPSGVFAEESAAASPIIKQPADISVSIPNEAVFEVGVDHPENYTYQWQYFQDGEGFWRDYMGEGAKVPVLKFSATNITMNTQEVRCLVKDKSDPEKIYESDKATLTLDNVEEIKNYVIAAGQGIAPGQTRNFGGGAMSLSEDGTIITLNNVDLAEREVPVLVGDLQGCLNYTNLEETPKPLTIKVIGKNTLTTNYSDDVGNGVNTMLYFASDNMPDVTVTGDTLILKGGEIGFNVGGRTGGTNCNLIMDANMELGTESDEWSTGIRCHDFTLKTGKTLNINRTNSALNVGGSVSLEPGSSLIAELTPKDEGSGFASVTAVRIQGGLFINQAAMEITVNVGKDSTRLAPLTALEIAGNCEESQEHLYAAGSSLKINLTSKGDNPDRTALGSISGINSTNKKGIDIFDNTALDIQINMPDGLDALAYNTASNLALKNGSDMTANVRADGSVMGVIAYDTMTVDDASINTSIDSLKKDSFSFALGAQHLKVNLTGPDNKVNATTTQGLALGQYLRDSEVAVGFDKTYQANRISLTGKAVFRTPADTVLSTGSLLVRAADEVNKELHQVFETPYSKADTSAPAKTVVIGVETPSPTPTPKPGPTPGPTPQPSVKNGPSTGLLKNGPDRAVMIASGLCLAVAAIAVIYGIKRKKD